MWKVKNVPDSLDLSDQGRRGQTTASCSPPSYGTSFPVWQVYRPNLAAVNSLKQHWQTYSALPDLVASFLTPHEALWSPVLMFLESLDMTWTAYPVLDCFPCHLVWGFAEKVNQAEWFLHIWEGIAYSSSFNPWEVSSLGGFFIKMKVSGKSPSRHLSELWMRSWLKKITW